MNYKAILFCPDENTARTVTQVLTELDFSVEPSVEPFAAVKKLTSEHFDALVVDGDNQQNATLLFKTARNSGLNQNSLAVAIVEGQSGVAKAFQIGANLVLTKPINVEQSKGTLRVARGLLRKTEAAKAAGTGPATDHVFTAPFSGSDAKPLPAPMHPLSMPANLTAPPPGRAAASPTALFETEAEPSPAPEAMEAALLESMPNPVVSKPRTTPSSAPPVSKPSPWQPVSQPMAQPVANALKHADQALGRTSTRTSDLSADNAIFSHASSGAAAAAAPARTPIKEVKEVDDLTEIPEASELVAPSPAPQSNRTALIAVLLVVVVAAAGYFGWTWTKTHPRLAVSAPQIRTTPAPPSATAPAVPANVPQTNPASPEIALPSASVISSPLPKTSPAVPAVTASTSPRTTPLPTTVAELPSAATKKAVTNISVSATPAPKQEVLVVNNQPSRPATPPPATQADAEPAPEASIVSTGSGDSAVSGLVQMPSSTPQPAPHSLRISQGISQGLLVKKVAPAYPPKALSMGIQGAVELLATISPTGSVTNIKLLNGDTQLARAAMDAVKQWKYKPYYLDDKPLEIQTEITVNFKLP
jgi:periplasmic protein TonB